MLYKNKKVLYWHCTSIMGNKKNTFIRLIFCIEQETGLLISVEF